MIKTNSWIRNIEGVEINLKKDIKIKDTVYYSAYIGGNKDYVLKFDIDNPSDIEQDGFEEVICNICNDFVFMHMFPKYSSFRDVNAYQDLDDDSRYKIYEEHINQHLKVIKLVSDEWIKKNTIKAIWKKRMSM